ncbi:MAG: tetratricopeptide repeat protein [Burkholderiales bacterium]
MQLMRWTVVACLILAFSAQAGDWKPLSREQALKQTRSEHADRRRLAYGRLAEVGTLEDVPVVLAGLWDDEALVRGMAEQVVWGIWMRTGDSNIDPMFQSGMTLISENEPAAAIEKLNDVIALRPEFAEAWNRRGDAWASTGDEARALADYMRTIELNPYHFGALESCGRIWFERRENRKAAEFFRRAVEINPNLWNVVDVLRRLNEMLENDRI